MHNSTDWNSKMFAKKDFAVLLATVCGSVGPQTVTPEGITTICGSAKIGEILLGNRHFASRRRRKPGLFNILGVRGSGKTTS